MGFFRFITFDPYRSFSEAEKGFTERRFYREDGAPTYDAPSDTPFAQTVWRIGRSAYSTVAKKIGKEPKAEDFHLLASEIKAFEEEFIPCADKWIQEGQCIIKDNRDDPPLKSLSEMNDAPDGWFLECAMRITKSVIKVSGLPADKFPDYEKLLAATACMYIDDCIIADINGFRLDIPMEVVQTSIAGAELYRETTEAIDAAHKGRATKAAHASHAEDRELKAQALAWYAEHKAEYSSKDEAAIAITKQVPVKFATARKWLKNQ